MYCVNASSSKVDKIVGNSDLGDATVNNLFANYAKKAVTIPVGAYRLYAVANGEAKGILEASSTEADLQAAIVDAAAWNATVPAGGLLMASRSTGLSGVSYFNLTVTSSHTASNPASVTISLERGVAKGKVKKAAEEFAVTDGTNEVGKIAINK